MDKSKTNRTFLLISILLILAIIVGHAQSVPLRHRRRLTRTPFCWKSIDTMFVFGDSYSSIGGKTGSNSTWNLFKTEDAVKNDMIIPNQTTAGGPNWNEFLTGCYEGLPQYCKPHRLFNLAYSGATINENLVKPWRPIIADFEKQAQLWKTHVVPNVQWTNGLVAVWFGINDVDISEGVPDDAIENLFENILKTYFRQLDLFYAQNMTQFVLINVPPTDRSPKYAAVQEHLAMRLRLFNTRLSVSIGQFQKTHPDTTIIEVDAHHIFSTLLNQAQNYGIKYITDFYEQKRENPIEQYFWNDNLHPTYIVHKAFADAVQNQLQKNSSC